MQPPYKRCRYFFELQAGAERVFYFEDGFHSPEDVKNGQLGQCFTFPWMNPVDINVTPKWVRETVFYCTVDESGRYKPHTCMGK